MNLQISGKHMNVGDALTSRIEHRIEDAVSKYFNGGFSGNVTLEKHGNRFACDCTIRLDSGVSLQGTSTEVDATAAFDIAAERIEKRLRRYKRRLKDHHQVNSDKILADAAYTIVESPENEEEVPDDYNPVIIAESLTSVESLSVADAVMQLDRVDDPVIVFTNAGNGRTNVVYRRSDGNIGWIDPSS